METNYGFNESDLVFQRFALHGDLPERLKATFDFTKETVPNFCATHKFIDVESCPVNAPPAQRVQQISSRMRKESELEMEEAELEKLEEQRMKRALQVREVTQKIYNWRRPENISPNYRLFQRGNTHLQNIPLNCSRQEARPLCMPKFLPSLFDDGWFWTAVSMISLNRNLLTNLFVSAESANVGLYALQFYAPPKALEQQGEWQCVVIDDQVPCDEHLRPCIGRTLESDELWPVILEKGYAKFLGAYSLLQGGDTVDAVQAMSQGSCRLFRWNERKMDVGTMSTIWWMLQEGYTFGLLQSLVFFDRLASDPQEGITEVPHFGIDNNIDPTARRNWNDTAVTVLYATKLQAQNQRLVRIRNAFGDMNWQGHWCDSSPMWTKDVRDALQHRVPDDYATWMKVDDLCLQFNTMLICSNFISSEFYANFHRIAAHPDRLIDHHAHQYSIIVKPRDASLVPAGEVGLHTPEKKPSAKDEERVEVEIYLSQPQRDFMSTANPKDIEVHLVKVAEEGLLDCECHVALDGTKEETYRLKPAPQVKMIEEVLGSGYQKKFTASLVAGNYNVIIHQQFGREELFYLAVIKTLGGGPQCRVNLLGSCASPVPRPPKKTVILPSPMRGAPSPKRTL